MSLSKYYRYSVNDFCELHNKRYPQASSLTLTTFNSSLKRIEKIYKKKLELLHLSFLDNVDEFVEKLQPYSTNTILSTLASITKLNKLIDANAVITRNFLMKLKELKTKNDKDNNKTTDDENYLDFLIIKNKVIETHNDYLTSDKTLPDYRAFLELALFSLQIPTRIQNFLNMYYLEENNINNLKDEKYKNNNKNFIVKVDGDYIFIFNRYKTSKFYGQQILKVNNQILKKLIDKWFTSYNTTKKLFLIDENTRAISQVLFTKDLKTISKKLFNVSFSVNILRSSFITMLYNNNPDFRVKESIAQLMGHTTAIQEIQYNRINPGINKPYLEYLI